MKVLPDEKMGQKLFSNRQILFRLHCFTPILVWPQALYSLYSQKIYLMSAKIRSCLFSRSSVAHIFETYTHKKIAVGRNYVSLSSPSPRWLHFKRLTVVRIILCDKWGVRGGGSFAPGGMPGSLLLWVITPLTKSGDIHSHGHV